MRGEPRYAVIRLGPDAHTIVAHSLGSRHRRYLFKVAGAAGAFGSMPIALSLLALSGAGPAAPELPLLLLLSWVLGFLSASLALLWADRHAGPPFH